jgi:GNAT superfamily N-acetyltransferase
MHTHREGTLIIKVRKAKKTDASAILDLVRGKAEFDGCLDSLQSTKTEIEEAFFSEKPKVHALLAMNSGEAVGIATYYSIYSTFIAKPGIWLDDLFVYPGSRGSGVGATLLSELCIVAQNTGCGRIDWIVATDNDRGRSFYERSGAQIFEEVRHARLDERAINALAQKAPRQAIHPTSV